MRPGRLNFTTPEIFSSLKFDACFRLYLALNLTEQGYAFIPDRRKIYILKTRVLRAEILPPLFQVCGASLDLPRSVADFLGLVSANFIDLLAFAVSQDNLVVYVLASFVKPAQISKFRQYYFKGFYVV